MFLFARQINSGDDEMKEELVKRYLSLTDEEHRENIKKASENLKGIIRKTALIRSDSYSAEYGCDIYIKPENLQNIFNPFFTTKPVGQGTGMGLSISYDIIVNRHKGDIWVESTDGAGAKFTFKLPIRHDGETAPPPAADHLAGIVQQGE